MKLALSQRREMLLYPAILYTIAFILGLVFFWGNGGLVHIDEMHWIERAHTLIAKNGIPEYNWQHTQFYNYFLAICILLFGENYFLIHLVQNFLIAAFPVIVYFTLRYCCCEKKNPQPETAGSYQINGRNGSLTIPLFGGLVAVTSFFSTYITANLILENLGFIFFGLSLYLWHRYYTEAGTKSDVKNIFWASVCTGITFNFKELSTLMYILPLIYILWRTRKTLTFQKVIVLFGVLLISVAPFLLIQLVSDFYYLQFLLESSASLQADFFGSILVSSTTWITIIFSYMPILATLGIIGGILFIITWIRKRSQVQNMSRLDFLAFLSILSIMGYGVFLILRPGMQYSVMLLMPLTFIVSWFIYQFLPQNRIPTKKTGGDHIPIRARHLSREGILLATIIGSQAFIASLAMVITKPVIYESYNVWSSISLKVGNNATYLCNVLGDIYFLNAYGPATWHASYRRNGWQTYNQDDLRELTTDALVHEWNIKNIVVEEGVTPNTYISNLINTNGTLVSKESYLFIAPTSSPFVTHNYTILLYYIRG